jgi:putative flippase GtrA
MTGDRLFLPKPEPPTFRISRRWLPFGTVGAMGFMVQLALLKLLISWMGWNYLLATLAATEAAILHNFAWHQRWTWMDRTCGERSSVLQRAFRFHLANGAFSLAGNLLLMRFLAGALAMNYLLANSLSVAAFSIVNFLASDRLVFTPVGKEDERDPKPGPARTAQQQHLGLPPEGRDFSDPALRKLCLPIVWLSLSFWLGWSAKLEAAELRPATMQAWADSIQATERRIAEELASPKGFLALDFQQAHEAEAERRAALSGRIPVAKMATVGQDGARIAVPDGMIHHWRGSVYIPGVTLEVVLSRTANPDLEDTRQEDVLDSAVLERGPHSLKLYLKLQRSKFVTAVYNTEHLVRYDRLSERYAASRSVAIKIAELENPNTGWEREKPQGRDRGFVWRLNSYWRYEQTDRGVIVECESLSLSRTVPAFLEYWIRPLIDRVAAESMQRTLGSMRQRLISAKTTRSGFSALPVAVLCRSAGAAIMDP